LSQVSIFYIFVVAFGLSMDTFAVSTAVGMGYKPVTGRTLFRISFHFALFQVALFALGCLAGGFLERYFGGYDHWLACGLLWLIGAHMCWEWRHESPRQYATDPSKGLSLIVLSVATSVDALAVGTSLGLLGASVGLSAAILAGMTATLAILGLEIGKNLGKLLGRWGMLVGGIALLSLGVKVVLEHLKGR